MALSNLEVEEIHFKKFGYVTTGLGHFARAIEAEVRAQDTALIRQLVEAVKMDRIDWEDWPADSRTAFEGLHARLKDIAP